MAPIEKIRHMNSPNLSVLKKGLLITICTIFFISCNKNEPNENIEQLLKEKFEGRYELISSISEEAVNLNNDGSSSTNLLSKNSSISFYSMVEIRILNEYELFYDEMWPVENSQRLRYKEIISSTYPPIINPYYDTFSNGFISQFDDDFKSIRLLRDIQNDPKNTLISIESIIIEENETIKVTSIRKLYTDKGWITTKIESRYKRYTNIT